MTGAVHVSFMRHPGRAQFRAADSDAQESDASRALWPESPDATDHAD